MKFTTITSILFLLRFQCTRAAGSGILHFVNFSTHWGTDQENNCCPSGQHTNCPGQCEAHLTICIGDVSPDRNCLYGEGTFNFQVDELTETVTFGEVLGSMPNPIVYRFDTWKLGVAVDVYVVMGELTDTITFNLHTEPGQSEPGHTGQVYRPRLYTGHRTGVTVDYSMACDPFHFGDCSIFCLPDPAMYTCDSDGSKRCIPDIDCGFEFSHDQTTSTSAEPIEVLESHPTISIDNPGSSVGPLYVNEYIKLSSGPPDGSIAYTESIEELATTERDRMAERTSRSFDINTFPGEKPVISSQQYGVTSTHQYSDPTISFVTNTEKPEVDSSDIPKSTIALETTTVGETRTTDEMSNSFGEVSEETIPDTFTETTRRDNSVSTTTPSAIDSTTSTVPYVCIGHVSISEENTGMLEYTVSQHATDNTVDFASYRSSPNPEHSGNTISEHDLITSFTVSSNQDHVESSTSYSDVDVAGSSSTAIDVHYTSEVIPDPDVTHFVPESTDHVPTSNTYNYDAFVTTTSSNRKLPSKTSPVKTYNTHSVTSFASTPQMTTEIVPSGETDSLSSVAASETLPTLALLTNTVLYTTILPVTASVVVTSPEPSVASSFTSDLVFSVTPNTPTAGVTTTEPGVSSNVTTPLLVSSGEGTTTPPLVVSSAESSSSNSDVTSSTKQSVVFTEESSLSNSVVTMTNVVESSKEPTKYDTTSTKSPDVSSGESSAFNHDVTTTEKHDPSNTIKTATTTSTVKVGSYLSTVKHTEGTSQAGTFNVSAESYLSTVNRPLTSSHTGITQEATIRSITTTIAPNKLELLTPQEHNDTVHTSSGVSIAAVGTTDEPKSPNTYPTEQYMSVYPTGTSATTINSLLKASPYASLVTNKVTKEVPVSTASSSRYSNITTNGANTSSQTKQETQPSISNTESLIQDGGKASLFTRIPTVTHPGLPGSSTTMRSSSSCIPAVVYPGAGKAVLTVQIAEGEQAVSVVTLRKKVVHLLVSAGHKMDVQEVNVIKTRFDGLTIVNITIDGADLTLNAAALIYVGDKICKAASVFLVQPSTPVRAEDVDRDVIAGVVVLVAYLTTLFIIAVVLVRRKYHEKNRVSGRPMSEVSKVTRTTELLPDRPETGMTGISSEYAESNC